VRLAEAALALCFAVFVAVLGPARAVAQVDDDQVPPSHKYISPERFVIELRVGPYQPDMGGNDAFNRFFSGDEGPLLGLELDVIGYRLPDLVYLDVGGGIGTASFSGKSLDTSGVATAENTFLTYLPLSLLGVVRVDALARKLSVPFIITGKLGYQWAHWTAQTGNLSEQTGWSVGLQWGAQLALDLDAFDRKAARTMDEEWGINHSFAFFEIFGFAPSSHSLPLGNTAWTAGLGFVF
jgi:hypothetical protein